MSSSIPPLAFSSACLLRSSSMSPLIQTPAPPPRPPSPPPHPLLGPLATPGSGLGRRSGPARESSEGWCSGKCGRDLHGGRLVSRNNRSKEVVQARMLAGSAVEEGSLDGASTAGKSRWFRFCLFSKMDDDERLFNRKFRAGLYTIQWDSTRQATTNPIPMFIRSYESKRLIVSITTDRIDLYTANVPAHLQYKEHTIPLSYSLRSKI
ncbi:hypothetical protein TRIUR3_26721 [Triticum urartu]|uniref:Uncharacterized protein n=1 Tax=Triticum urartu TaxID=4572 RepID=M7ZSU7_TRIUA|nr:hypothetical protein TRIUR3_26721 [Triticum urartu]